LVPGCRAVASRRRFRSHADASLAAAHKDGFAAWSEGTGRNGRHRREEDRYRLGSQLRRFALPDARLSDSLGAGRAVQHERLGAIELFLVPIAADRYEAVFT
jgi:hypothetical protein